MYVDEFVVRQICHEKRVGYWKVNQKCFFDKTDCLRYASSINDENITYHYLDEVYKKLDWSKEPSESLDKLYSLRAQQLRDKYSYLVLGFSGGEDSKNILDVFLKNKIKLDEVVSYAPIQAMEKLRQHFDPSNKSPEWGIFEYDLAVVPVLESLRITNPEIKITILDSTESTIDIVLNDSIHTLNKSGYSPTLGFAGGEIVARHMTTLKKSCLINGFDKPRIIYDSANHRFGQLFSDFTNAGTAYNDRWHDRKTVVEGFYHTHEFPEITLKQSIAIKNFLQPISKDLAKGKQFERLTGTHRLNGLIDINVHDPVIERVIYPSLEFPQWQANKVTSYFYMENANWLLKSKLSEKRINDFFDGQLTSIISGINEKFINYRDGKPTGFKDYCTSFNWL